VPSEDHENQSDQLQSLIADYHEAENRGERIDRNLLVKEHPELADSLLAFFANHDKTKAQDTPALASGEMATTPPRRATEDIPTLGTAPPPVDRANAVGQIRHFGDYELLTEIARGGMGIVFKARQRKLNRIVALKMILAGQFAGENDVQRFHTEAESAAQLDHPGIVPIFEIGEHQGQHYFSMSYVEGESLADRVAKGPLPPRDAAALLQKISEAMAYAHGRGVIHRDLKPANILIDASGQPKITDFGLAKKTEADSDLTGTGQILGTPAYMPPEQASGKVDQVGPLADVYSLGAILYCLLTGRPPFQAASPMDVLRQVLDKDPISVRQLVPTIPRDLSTICGKCLSKDPEKRYASAADLAADLQRFLDDQPILARPAGRIERASKWASKQPAVAAILLTLPAWLLGEPKIGVGLLALVAGFHLPFRFRFLRLLTIFALAIMAAVTIGGLSYLFVWSDSEALGSMARLAAISLLSSTAPAGAALFVFIFDCVSQLPQPHRRQARWLLLASAAASLLCIGGFFYYLRFHSEQVSGIVDQLADEIVSLTTDSQSDVAEARSSDAMVQLFRSRTLLWIPIFTAIIWLYLALGIITARFIRRFVFVTVTTIKSPQGRQPSRLVKAVDGDVSRWVAISAAVIIAILPYAVGRLLGIYDVQRMRAFELGNPLDSVVWVVAAAWLAAYAVISRHRFLVASGVGACLLILLSFWTRDSIESNRRRLPVGDSASEIAASESLLQRFDGHTGPVKCVDIDNSGKLAASVSGWPKGDGTIRVWDLKSGKMLWVRHLGPELMMAVRFTSDGKKLVSGGRDGTLCVWEAETARELIRIQTAAKIEGLRLFSDDKHCVISADKVQVWNLETAELAREFEGTNGTQLDVSISGDAKRVATGGMDKAVHVWEFESGKQIAHITDLPMVESVALNEDGSRLLVALNGSSNNPVLLSISVSDPKDRKTLIGHKSTVNWVRYSPDGEFFVTASRDKTIRIWNADTNSEIEVIRGHQDWVWSAVFTPDGKRILSGGGGQSTEDPGTDFSLRLWNVDELAPQPTSD
jgi:WD40 repeat protein/tRNA A-37 threonylcarbamoyl transferase component Bud32